MLSLQDKLWFVESKSDDLDFFDIPGYEMKMKNRKKVAKLKSGGITIAYKTEISDKIQLIATERKFVLWFKIASTYLSLEEDIVVGVVYICLIFVSFGFVSFRFALYRYPLLTVGLVKIIS